MLTHDRTPSEHHLARGGSPHENLSLASGHVSSTDVLSIDLTQPAGMPPIVKITWPLQPTVCEPSRYNEVAAAAMKLLAEASTALAGIRARRRL